jgi:hypothetical protein
MSESDETYDLMTKEHGALYDEIVKNAWSIAGEMVTGTSRLVDGIYIPAEYLILKKIHKEVKEKLQG